ncbi:Mbov_0396 family ICE element transmembrane protein [Mycoplasma mycoides]|uniref:Mbov_0396 family ICE element transmembrane protein n=1 Tax=Mycoplasma mycoides TaxID=2102 RepID=UPI002735E1D4|nr:E3 binding domain-containing protein [Mycoplasma mycoides]MDP4040821.1 E3 binding domain-containing protein [Mycoplasma mycoides]MDP4041682.1 E3 binding domain-containing protein [Mycoplasma mycoides]MDP4042572.1 E3 binding domain-containing protein [Mycoplasma mycoides]MDP4044046.1 E3 binding domain-containing protein [Mycoplasma mycoides]MDP4044917.1 E3 binding domain-containing protein [Mycoplasma mycoides]
MFKAIKDFINTAGRIFNNLPNFLLWSLLLPLLAIPAGLAVIVDFFGRDLIKLLIFGGDDFDVSKLPQAFKTIAIIAAAIAIISFIFFFVFLIAKEDSRKHIKQTIKGIVIATLFVSTMPIAFFLLQYVVSIFFDLIKLAFGLENQSASQTVMENILKTGKIKPLKEGMEYNEISLNMKLTTFLDWVEHINPIFPLITTVLVTWTYIQFSIAIMQKSMELFTLFITSPIYGITAVFDGQKIFKKYIREKIIGKSFAVLGLMFIWNVSFLFLNYFTNRLLDPIVAAITSSGKAGHISNFGDSIIKSLVTLVGIVSSATFVSKGANLLGDLTGESISVWSPAAVLKFAGKVTKAGIGAGISKFKNKKNNSSPNSTDTSETSSYSTTNNNSTSVVKQSISDKVNKSKLPSRNSGVILKGESSIAAVNQKRINNSKNSAELARSNFFEDKIEPAKIDKIKTQQLAKANNVDLSTITGSGQNGRILKSDVQNAINNQKAIKTLTTPNSFNNNSDDKTFFDKLTKSDSNNSIVDKLQAKEEKVNKKQPTKNNDEDIEKKKSTLEKFKENYKKLSEKEDKKLMLQELKKLNKSIEKFAKQLNKSKVISENSDKISKTKSFKLFDFNKFNNTKPSFEVKQPNLSLQNNQKPFKITIFKKELESEKQDLFNNKLIQNNQSITDKKIDSKSNKLNIFKKKDKEVKK